MRLRKQEGDELMLTIDESGVPEKLATMAVAASNIQKTWKDTFEADN